MVFLRSQTLLTCLGLFLAASICGCDSGISRVSIEGKVTYQGKPLGGGEVEFRPAAGPGCGADITPDGTFKVARENGPMPGKCRVIVEQFKEVTETDTDGRTTSRRQSLLPAKFRDKPREVTFVKGHNKIVIDLDTWESP